MRRKEKYNDTDRTDDYDCNGGPWNSCHTVPAVSDFPAGKPTPKYIQYLGKVLPAAVFGLLVIYSLKNVSIFTGSHGLPELISIVLVIVLHVWKRQMLLSIAGGTVCYMLLVQFVF